MHYLLIVIQFKVLFCSQGWQEFSAGGRVADVLKRAADRQQARVGLKP